MSDRPPEGDDGFLDLFERWQALRGEGKAVRAVDLCPGDPARAAELERLARFAGQVEGLAGTPGFSTIGHAGEFTAAAPLAALPALQATTVVLLGVSGRYRVEAALGVGGMGAVYRAQDLQLGRRVALKLIRPERMSTDMLARFQVEARAVAALDQPHIIKLFDIGTWRPPGETSEVPFLSMELAEGGSLAGRLPPGVPQRPEDTARLVALLARAMAHAHSRGVVHRDLKPENVLLAPPAGLPALDTAWGCPKITDFGLAMWSGASGKLTRDREVLGTPAYMAPEQADGRADVGPPTDVYALGVLLYRMLSGRLPFDCPSLAEMLYKIAHVKPPPLTNVSAELARLVASCLDKAPSRRPTMIALAERLESWCAKGQTDVLPPAGPAWPSRRLLAGVGLSVLAVAAVALVAWAWVRGRAPSHEPAREFGVKRFAAKCYANDAGRGESEYIGTVSGEAVEGHLASVPYAAGVILHADFRGPAHAYLIALNANGAEQLLWPGPGEAPPAVERLRYPEGVGPNGRPNAFFVDDEVRGGLQAFALILSRAPLPPYEQWKKARGAVPWRRITGVGGPYVADLTGVWPIFAGKGATRGTVGELGKGPDLLPLCRSLKAGDVEAVELLALPVGAK